MKQCSKCKEYYPVEQFYSRLDRKSGKESNCSHCIKARKKKWFATHKHDSGPRYKNLIQTAKTRNIECNLTEKEYIELIKSPCHYCKDSLEQHTGSGLDRLDCKIGYIVTNVVACCTKCNSGKGDKFTSEEWKIMIDALLKSRVR